MFGVKSICRRVLGIVGSPRSGGNTEILVDTVLRGSEEVGAQVEKVILSELDIAPCQACNACRNTGECVQRDDMAALLEKMQRSQVWVLGTPVYYFGPTAQFKAFIDRWYIGRAETFKGRYVILTISFEDPDPNIARYAVGMLADSLAWKKAELFATVLVPSASDRGKVRQYTDVLAATFLAGQEAIQK